VLLLTKSAEAASLFGAMFSSREVHKTYLALVRGFTDDADTIHRPLVSDKGQRKSVANPQPAETFYRTLERFELPIAQGQHSTTRCSLLKAHPKTGRFHQIRRHMAGIAHPVIGDAYHGDTRFNRHIQQYAGASRLMLAATCLEFAHPTTGCNVVIECPPDASFSHVLDAMRQMKTNRTSDPN
jgi:tRNA pseudouridine65 synthase